MRICALALLLISAQAFAEDLHEYVIERNIPGASQLSPAQLKAISLKSRDVLKSLGDSVKWHRSYVAEDKFYCLYTAPSKEAIRRHAELGGFPADRIEQVSAVIDPGTAE